MAGRSKTPEYVGNAKAILEAAYTPQATRAELAEAVGEALDFLSDYDSIEPEDEDPEGDDDDE